MVRLKSDFKLLSTSLFTKHPLRYRDLSIGKDREMVLRNVHCYLLSTQTAPKPTQGTMSLFEHALGRWGGQSAGSADN